MVGPHPIGVRLVATVRMRIVRLGRPVTGRTAIVLPGRRVTVRRPIGRVGTDRPQTARAGAVPIARPTAAISPPVTVRPTTAVPPGTTARHLTDGHREATVRTRIVRLGRPVTGRTAIVLPGRRVTVRRPIGRVGTDRPQTARAGAVPIARPTAAISPPVTVRPTTAVPPEMTGRRLIVGRRVRIDPDLTAASPADVRPLIGRPTAGRVRIGPRTTGPRTTGRRNHVRNRIEIGRPTIGGRPAPMIVHIRIAPRVPMVPDLGRTVPGGTAIVPVAGIGQRHPTDRLAKAIDRLTAVGTTDRPPSVIAGRHVPTVIGRRMGGRVATAIGPAQVGRRAMMIDRDTTAIPSRWTGMSIAPVRVRGRHRNGRISVVI